MPHNPPNSEAPEVAASEASELITHHQEGTESMSTITPPEDTGQLIRCGNCGRFGWHTTERCPFPPAQPSAPPVLDDAVNRIDLIRADLNAVIRDLPDNTPMFAIVDIVNALSNLRNAAVLLDKAADTLEADAQEVLR